MSQESSTNRDPLSLHPPTFCLPEDWDEDEDSSRYELWSVRIPVSLEVNNLDGKVLASSQERPPEQGTKIGTFENEGKQYAFMNGHQVENESFRILLPASSEDKETDNVDEMNLVPSSVPFARHVNVVNASCLQEIPDTELAPRLEIAPSPADPVRRAYAPVPQKTGLKRRWMPAGAVTVKPEMGSVHMEIDTNVPVVQRTTKLKSPKRTKKRSKREASPAQSQNKVTAKEGAPTEDNRKENPKQTSSLVLSKEEDNPSSAKKKQKKAKKERKEKKKTKKERKKEKKEAKKLKKGES